MFKNITDYKITLVVLVSFLSLNVLAEGWNIRAEKTAKNSNLKFTTTTAKQGEDIFTKNCVSCHGNLGKGNNLKSLQPPPPDLAGSLTQKRSDGDLFYIITTGRNVMPSFSNVFSEEQRWQIISYLRSFNKNYVQVLSGFDSGKSKLVKISLILDSINHTLKVNVVANEKSGIVKLHDDEIILFANRYFGRLQLDKTLKTDANGDATFNLPTDLPGDKVGNIDLIVKVTDDNYGDKEYHNKLKIGIPTDKPGLTEKRAIWNVVSKAPIWLLITYLSCVLFVTACFLYIFFNLYKIFKLGKNQKSKS